MNKAQYICIGKEVWHFELENENTTEGERYTYLGVELIKMGHKEDSIINSKIKIP